MWLQYLNSSPLLLPHTSVFMTQLNKMTILSYLYLAIYLISGVLILSSSSTLMVWVLMEVMIFIFIGMVFNDSPVTPSFMLYFILQSLSSIIILYLLVFSSWYCAMLSFHCFCMINLAIFPMFLWYYTVLSSFSSFSLVLALSLQKFPVLYLVYLTYNSFSAQTVSSVTFVVTFIVVSLFISAVVGIVASGLKSVLIWSSLVNSVWLYLSAFAGFTAMLIYFILYTMLLIVIMAHTFWLSHVNSDPILVLVLFALIGLPPFPLFFVNLYVIFCLVGLFGISAALLPLLLLVVFTVCAIVIYFRFIVTLVVLS